MATIFQKTADDNCLILNPRESLTYPFSFGSNWSEIRLGAYISVTSTSGDNTFFGGNESYTYNSGLSATFFGISSSGNTFPGVNGQTYAGLGVSIVDQTITSITNNTISFNSTNDNAGLTLVDSSGNYYQGSIINGQGIRYTDTTGDTSYATFYGLKFSIDSTSNLNAYTMRNTTPVTDPSVAALQQQLASQPSVQSLGTKYFLNGFTSSGSPIPLPNSVFIYFPFLNNRIRIHSLLVEKYA